jgi:hypothetical protein
MAKKSCNFNILLLKHPMEEISTGRLTEPITVRDWLTQVGFSCDGIPQEQIDNTYQFVFIAEDLHPESSGIKQFFENPTVLTAARKAFGLYQDEKREATGDPYFKHALKTAYLSSKMINPDELGQDYWEVMVVTCFSHDLIEIRRDKDGYNVEQLTEDLIEAGVEERQAKRITYLTDKMTPSPKEEETFFDGRRGKKQADFVRIMEERCDDWQGSDKEMMAAILRLVKALDVLANLEETVADWLIGRQDGTFIGKPIEYVVGVFGDRVQYLETHRGLISDDIVDRLSFQFTQLDQLLGNFTSAISTDEVD